MELFDQSLCLGEHDLGEAQVLLGGGDEGVDQLHRVVLDGRYEDGGEGDQQGNALGLRLFRYLFGLFCLFCFFVRVR